MSWDWESVVLGSMLSFLLPALGNLDFDSLMLSLTSGAWGVVSPSEELFFPVRLMVKLNRVFLNKPSSYGFLFSRISARKESKTVKPL